MEREIYLLLCAVAMFLQVPLHVYAKLTYECAQFSLVGDNKKVSSTVGYKILLNWGFGLIQTIIIVNCTFLEPLNTNNSSGKLVLFASTSSGVDANFNTTDKIETLMKQPCSPRSPNMITCTMVTETTRAILMTTMRQTSRVETKVSRRSLAAGEGVRKVRKHGRGGNPNSKIV